MRARIERIVAGYATEHDGIALHDFVLRVIREEYERRYGVMSHAVMQGDVLDRCRVLFSRRPVRYRLALLELLGWQVALLPHERFWPKPDRTRDLHMREFGYRPSGTSRIDRRAGRDIHSAIGSATVSGDRCSMMLPTVCIGKIARDEKALRDLPVGTVLVEDIEIDDFGIIDHAIIGSERGGKSPKAKNEAITEDAGRRTANVL
jgi:hypothetical protein